MDLSNLNTENIYKFLTTIGIVMIIFSIMYPMEKKNEIELKTNDYKKEMSLNYIEYKVFSDSINYLDKKIKKEILDLNSKEELDSAKIKKTRLEIKKTYADLQIKKVKLKKQDSLNFYKNKEIEILIKQKNDFKTKEKTLFIAGILFVAIGFIFWFIKDKNDDGITKIKIMP